MYVCKYCMYVGTVCMYSMYVLYVCMYVLVRIILYAHMYVCTYVDWKSTDEDLLACIHVH